VSRAQTNVADMQQSLRIGQYQMVRMARMAGRGGLPPILPAKALPTGVGISVQNNVTEPTYLVASDSSAPKVLAGTDVLTLRGVFSTPVYQVASANAASFKLTGPGTPTPATATGGTVEVCTVTPSGANQDLTPLTSLIDQAKTNPAKASKEGVILVSPLDDGIYGVVQLDPATSTKTVTGCPTASGVTLAFKCDRSDSLTSQYRDLGPASAGANLHPALTKVGFLGVVEEYRYYVREDHAVPNDAKSDLMPVLSRARFYPGTNQVYATDNDNLRQDIADGILDLQIALGLDVDGDGLVKEDTANPANDEWLGNAPGEAVIAGELKAVRISTLARTNRADPCYSAPELVGVEDHSYDVTDPNDRVNGTIASHFRRRLLQTIANLRNLTT
jgi:Type IV Pilus-assembly protein W